jgi:hypothetical protein
MLDDIFNSDELPNHKVYEVAQMVVRDYMNAENKKIEYVAERLGTTKGYLYASIDPNQTNKPLSIDRIFAITKLTNDMRILEVVANEFDMVLIHKKQSEANIADINLLVDRANIENSDVFREIKRAIEDGVIDEDEQRKILKEIDEAQKANAELKDRVLHVAIEKNK